MMVDPPAVADGWSESSFMSALQRIQYMKVLRTTAALKGSDRCTKELYKVVPNAVGILVLGYMSLVQGAMAWKLDWDEPEDVDAALAEMHGRVDLILAADCCYVDEVLAAWT